MRFLVRKPFTFAGRDYAAGDEFDADGVHPMKVDNMMKARMIVGSSGDILRGHQGRSAAHAAPVHTGKAGRSSVPAGKD